MKSLGNHVAPPEWTFYDASRLRDHCPRGVLSRELMARLGTEKHLAIVRVQSWERAREIAAFCSAHQIHYIIGLEPDRPEDLTDVDRALNPSEPMRLTSKAGRN